MRLPPRAPDPALQYAYVLYGWGEIANYLRRSRSTVMRWHKGRAMPITVLGVHIVIPRSALDLWVLAGRMAKRA